ncbi:MAG TPA: hypothetical protein PKK06_11475, partial [Phycisphaerae bacterium]|nr:hypothetical protein [Phycisphaerae bacterium]HNU45861.1 hypothetical protein [Phycisphaerae bacterium]
MTRLVVAGLLALLVVAGAPGARADMLIGASWDGTIYDIDPTTGLASNPRATGLSGLAGIDFSAQGTLFAMTVLEGNASNSLYTLNVATGAAEYVGATGFAGMLEGDLASDPAGSDLYGVLSFAGGTGFRLIRLDRQTGQGEYIGRVPGSRDISGLAFDAAGTLFGLDTQNDELLTLDKDSADVLGSVVLSHAFADHGAMRFGPDDVLYAVDGGTGLMGVLYSIDTSSGWVMQVGATGVPGGFSALTVPEPCTLLLLLLGGVLLHRCRACSRGERRGLGAWQAAAGVVLALTTVCQAQMGGQSYPEPPALSSETGLGPLPSYSLLLHGGFVTAGTSTRLCQGPPQVDPFELTLEGVPTSSTILLALAHWSYLTDDPTDPGLRTIFINGSEVSGALVGEAEPDLCWNRAATAAYEADVTSIVVTAGGNGTYTVAGAVDEGGALGEGLSLFVVYENSTLPLSRILVYRGLIQTSDGDYVAEATLGFGGDAYIGGPARLFLNAMDGQYTQNMAWADALFLNGFLASGFPGTGMAPDAWRGALGPGTPHTNYYDHAEGDSSPFMTPGTHEVTVRTESELDCIGHSFAAISFVSLDWCDDGP